MLSLRAPSWKAVALAILRNDHNLHSLGFQTKETELSINLYRSSASSEVHQTKLFTQAAE